MGFFGRKKKKVKAAVKDAIDVDAVMVEAPGVTTDPSIMVTSKEEPLLHDPYNPEMGDADVSVNTEYKETFFRKHILRKKKKVAAAASPTVAPASQVERNLSLKQSASEESILSPKRAVRACCALPLVVKLVFGGAVAAALALGAVSFAKSNIEGQNVAFAGNSYMLVNDLPRLMETMADGQMHQDSCLHGSGSILNLLKTGNGMYGRWETEAAVIQFEEGDEYYHSYQNDEDEDGGDEDQEDLLFDYGACSVPQLLTGSDNLLSYENEEGSFVDDGTNPCLQDESYLAYENSRNFSSWDYLVLVDQSKRMCFDEARYEAFMAFNYTYAPILNNIGATPIIVQPHAFWSENANMTGLGDLTTFTSLIMEGAQVYKEFLDSKLRWTLKSKIARVGDAYLTVYEEDKSIWSKLFLGDGIHPSGYGSYLYGLVIHATIYGSMPKKSVVVTDDVMTDLFSHARVLHAYNSTMYPDEEEAKFLYTVARKVALRWHKPSSYRQRSDKEIEAEADELEDEYNENDAEQEAEEEAGEEDEYYNYDGNYNGN